MENPYPLVFDGKWTFDKMSEMTRDIYEDLNGSATADNEEWSMIGFSTAPV